MRYEDIVTLAFELWKGGAVETPLTLLGPPGIGKSSIGPDLAQRMGKYVQEAQPTAAGPLCEIIDLSSRLPEDIGGLPFRDKEGDIDTVLYAPQAWLARLCQDKVYGVLLLDDLPAAAPSVQVATRQLVLDRKVGDHKLSDGIMILVTGNRREDKSAASTLPAHFRNSVGLLELEPDLEGWCEWYGQQPNHAPIVSSFLRYRARLLSQLPKDADRRGAFATPRTWAKVGRAYDVANRLNAILDMASGLVGEGPATEFLAFVNVRSQLVDPAAVLNDPIKALPDPERNLAQVDRAYAMTTGLGETAAAWRTGKTKERREKAPLALMRALGHATQGNREYIATGVATYTSNGGTIHDLIQAVRKNMSDPLVKSVIDFLNRSW